MSQSKRIPAPSPRGTNFERLFITRSPLAAYDEAPGAGFDPVLAFLKGKLSPADLQQFSEMLERMSDEPVVAADDAEAELRHKKLTEALSALQNFVVEKLPAEDQARFDQLVEALLGAAGDKGMGQDVDIDRTSALADRPGAPGKPLRAMDRRMDGRYLAPNQAAHDAASKLAPGFSRVKLGA